MFFTQNIFTSLITIIPALVLCVLLYKKDTVEKEPVGLLILLFFLGVIAFIPSYFLGEFFYERIGKMFSEYMSLSPEGLISYTDNKKELLHNLLCSFGGTALIQEVFKWTVLVVVTGRNKEFNSLFDGIIYSAYVSIGFAIAGNTLDAFYCGWDTLAARIFIALPENLFFGIVMGLFYTLWHSYAQAKKQEADYITQNGLTVKRKIISKPFFVLSFVVPVIMHGVYSFAGMSRQNYAEIISCIFTVLFYVLSIVIVAVMSKSDGTDATVSQRVLNRKYGISGSKEEKI